MVAGPLSAGTPGKQAEGIGIAGAVTLTLYGPSGQTLGVWKTHNSLMKPGISYVVQCLTGGTSSCPNPSTPFTSFTSLMLIAFGGCAFTFLPNGAGNSINPCSLQGATTVTQTPAGCSSATDCTGWIATATFSASDIDSTQCSAYKCCPGPGSCLLNDVATALDVPFVGSLQFDDICAQAASPGTCNGAQASLPAGPNAIAIAQGDSLAINIQFTVS